jgi:plastocyanin
MKGKTGMVKWLIALMLTAGMLIPAGAASAATLDVTAYGADGSDALDDTTAIQDAIDAASAGDTVYIPAGTYYVSGQLDMKSDLVLKGAGRDSTGLIYTGTTDSVFIMLDDIDNAEISDMTLDGNLNSALNIAIRGDQGGGHYVHHMRIKDMVSNPAFGSIAIYFTNSPDPVVTDNILTNIGVDDTYGGGIRIAWNSDRGIVLRNTITDTGRGGIFGNNGCDNMIVRDNKISGSGHTVNGLSIELHTDCDGSVVEDNEVDHFISVVKSQHVAVRRNKVENLSGVYKGYGLELISGNSIATDNFVGDGNLVGISTSGVSDYQYIGHNTIDTLAQWGVQLQGSTANNTFVRYMYFYKNKFVHTDKDNVNARYPSFAGMGFRINNNTRDIVLDSNEINGNDRSGIQIGGSSGVDYVSIVNNEIKNNGTSSISSTLSGATHLEWENNTVTGNGTNTNLTTVGYSVYKPVADFSSLSSVSAGVPVTFTNTSTDSDGTISHVLWDLGAGAPTNTYSPTYTYDEPGTYRVTLVIWDNDNRAALKEKWITVY